MNSNALWRFNGSNRPNNYYATRTILLRMFVIVHTIILGYVYELYLSGGSQSRCQSSLYCNRSPVRASASSCFASLAATPSRILFMKSHCSGSMEALLTDLINRESSEKGDRGRIGVIGGSVDHTGPPALVGEAALRTGSDLVKVLTSEEMVTVVAGYSENLIVNQYTGGYLSEDSVSKALELSAWSDVLVIGPGLSEPDQEAVRRIVDEASVPLVVDAAAIEPALDGSFSRAIFTPDSREVERITAAYESLTSFSEQTRTVVVSTGASDKIHADGEHWTNETGMSAMTVGGTGDVLTGTIASILGQGLDRSDAARLGTWIAGTAGERAAEKYGIGLIARDIIECIPEIMMNYWNNSPPQFSSE